MTRDDIIRMAREAGALQIGFSKTIMQSEYSMFAHELERFAALVAAAERDRSAQMITNLLKRHKDDPRLSPILKRLRANIQHVQKQEAS